MKKLKNKKGFSTIELLCTSFIAVFVIFLLILAFLWYRKQVRMGDDQMLVNTAESVASLNTVGGDCVVRSCGGGNCVHLTSKGYVGYFDHPTNSIYGEKKSGYNEYKVMKIGDKKYYGDPGTMVIKVVSRDGELTLSWVKGDNN
ncbi:hypothetical protein [Hespellia stercorisuis]|uniref:Uncharacterized protein n=1 Tax=Hespellia stercorisuis DSM 15480 TaxID=1121950 RepID=A0A1M6R253_9FIRM|nr:hypothetical protein [Hespellia stercorisuis]SHK26522.1 hypothetical protein SAMN02745243_02585 [Hespellia stercorisuis DSM 15480]